MLKLRLSFALALVLGLLTFSSCQQKAAPPPPGPPEVGISTVGEKDITTYGNWVGSLDGYVNAQIQPEVAGYLVHQEYREGSFVNKGDILFEIDPRPFQAVLDQAKGQLAQAKGQLAQAEAAASLAQINLDRDKPLVEAHAVAQSQLDNDIQTQKQQAATVETGKASIASAEASVEQAQLNLGFTKVRSLVDGIAGTATIQIGNYVSQQSVLTTVSQVNPIKAYFPISEQEYLLVSQRINPGPNGDWLKHSGAVPLQLTLSNGSVYDRTGKIIFADRQVDSQTGTIRIVGAFPNPGNLLRPGQYCKVQAKTGIQQGALLIPQRAVTELQGGYQVALVTADNKVHVTPIKVGAREGEDWIITSGLKAGDRVVSEGVSKVRDGMAVVPKADNYKSTGA